MLHGEAAGGLIGQQARPAYIPLNLKCQTTMAVGISKAPATRACLRVANFNRSAITDQRVNRTSVGHANHMINPPHQDDTPL